MVETRMTQQEFIEKVVSGYDSAYTNKADVKQLFKIIFERLDKLEKLENEK